VDFKSSENYGGRFRREDNKAIKVCIPLKTKKQK
jgi:hypothetical protein